MLYMIWNGMHKCNELILKTQCVSRVKHRMVSTMVSTICPCRGLLGARLSVMMFTHFWFTFSGPWSPDARVWVRTNKSHLSSKPDGEREQPWEWKSTEEQPDSPCRGTQGQSLVIQFLRQNFLNVAEKYSFLREGTFFSAPVYYQQGGCVFILTVSIKLSKDATATKEVGKWWNIEVA